MNAPPVWLSSRPFRGVDVAVGVDGHALACRALIYPVVAFERRDEPGDEVLVDRAIRTPSRRVVIWTRLRFDHVDRRPCAAAIPERPSTPARLPRHSAASSESVPHSHHWG